MQYQNHFGKKFYLDKKTGYWISTNCPKIRAHVWVWRNHFGDVPKGNHIHHIDDDKSNNLIENLKMMTQHDHLSFHSSQSGNIERASKLCAIIRPLSKEWHASEEGYKWHSEHAKKTLSRKCPLEKECFSCLNKFMVDYLDFKRSKFCSNACKSKFRRINRLDHVGGECLNCKKIFYASKYAKTKCCSKSCAGEFRRHSKHSKAS